MTGLFQKGPSPRGPRGLGAAGRFFGSTLRRRALYLALVAVIALADYLYTGLARKTFVFYAIKEGAAAVEERMFRRSASAEADVRRYVEEVLLGPASPDLDPLFPRETRLEALLFRDGVVYANLSEVAALPLEGDAGGVLPNLRVLKDGIRRNFPAVKEVRLFIGGNEVFL